MTPLWSRLVAGLSGFRDAWLNANVQPSTAVDFDSFCRYDARRLRYDLFWSLYLGNTFQDSIHPWSPALKAARGLYRHTRNVINPVYRLIEFNVAHLMGGRLDPEAGDGERAKSALPILTANDGIRAPIAKFWRDSDWQTNKSIWTRYGAALGDPVLTIDDDPVRQRVTGRVIHPGTLKWVAKDVDGRVTAYLLEEWRPDPRPADVRTGPVVIDPSGQRRVVRYTEEAYADGGDVVYKTYLNGSPYDWRGKPAGSLPDEWRVPYPFVPMVVSQHMAVGLPWGLAEPHPLLAKVFEVQDMASGLSDQIRKAIRAPKLLAGVSNPRAQLDLQGAPPTAGNPDPSRQEMGYICAPAGAAAYDLTFNLDIAGVNEHIKSLCSEIERDFPELQMDIWATGDTSGRALRIARQRTESKIQERRSGYDAALVLGQKYALAIGGMRGYPGYEGMAYDPRGESPLDHEIGHRPVFSPDPMDDIEEGTAFWGMVNAAVSAGMPLEAILRREGWPESDIAEVARAREPRAAGVPVNPAPQDAPPPAA